MKSQIRFAKYAHNPIIPRTPGTFYSVHAANPDLHFFNGTYWLYFRGQAEEGHDQIGVCQAQPSHFDGVHWRMRSENPVLRVSADPAAFDSGHILDPAVLEVDGQVRLYYTAHRSDWNDWNIPSHTGLAVSDDGIHFEKWGKSPVALGTAPEIVHWNDRFYLLVQRKNQSGYFEIYCLTSSDGFHFQEALARPVFGPSKQAGAFDAFSVSTVRIWAEADWFYLFYGGCPRYFDYPGAIGLARSRNLLEWERYPGNPVLERGLPGTWDEGAIWFATVHRIGRKYYLWYEGAGTGLGNASPQATIESIRARNDDYGSYRISAFSQIGLAEYAAGSLDW